MLGGSGSGGIGEGVGEGGGWERGGVGVGGGGRRVRPRRKRRAGRFRRSRHSCEGHHGRLVLACVAPRLIGESRRGTRPPPARGATLRAVYAPFAGAPDNMPPFPGL